MPRLGPIKRKDLIKYLRQLGFDGPFSGGNHGYMKRGTLRLWIPNPHGDKTIDKNFLRRILQQANVRETEWEDL